MAEAVDILNHFNPLPPVPHTSIEFSFDLIFKEYSLIIDAIPANSVGVSSFNAIADIKAPNWEGKILPDMISLMQY